MVDHDVLVWHVEMPDPCGQHSQLHMHFSQNYSRHTPQTLSSRWMLSANDNFQWLLRWNSHQRRICSNLATCCHWRTLAQRSCHMSPMYGYIIYGVLRSIQPHFYTLAGRLFIDCRYKEDTKRLIYRYAWNQYAKYNGIWECKCTIHNYNHHHIQTTGPHSASYTTETYNSQSFITTYTRIRGPDYHHMYSTAPQCYVHAHTYIYIPWQPPHDAHPCVCTYQ